MGFGGCGGVDWGGARVDCLGGEGGFGIICWGGGRGGSVFVGGGGVVWGGGLLLGGGGVYVLLVGLSWLGCCGDGDCFFCVKIKKKFYFNV